MILATQGLSIALMRYGFAVKCVQLEHVKVHLCAVDGKTKRPTKGGYWSLKVWTKSGAEEWRSPVAAKCIDMAFRAFTNRYLEGGPDAG